MQDGDLQVPSQLLAKAHPTWVRLLAEESDTVLVLPDFYQQNFMSQVTVMYTFIRLAEPDSTKI